MRYANVETKKIQDGRKVLATKILFEIPKANSDIYIITQETDRLDTLANQFYSDPSLWWIISLANNLNRADIGVEPGIRLRIPTDISSIKSLL